MPLDLSDEALGIASAPRSTKKGELDLSDEALGLTPQAELSRAQLPAATSPVGIAGEAALAVLEQPGAGMYGLATQSYSGLKGLYKGAIGAAAGLSFGDIFKEEFNSSAENAAEAYIPLTPMGEKLTHKIGELFTSAIQGAGGFVFEKGMPVPPLLRPILSGVGSGEPAIAAGTEAAVAGALLFAPLARGKAKPGVEPPPTWEGFVAKYPEAAKSIDAGSLGAVRWRREDTSIAEAYSRQVNEELGLKGAAADLPFRDRVLILLDRTAPEVPIGEKMRAVQSIEKKIQLLDAARIDLSNKRGLPLLDEPAALSAPIIVDSKGVAVTPAQSARLVEQFRSGTVSQNAEALRLSVMSQLKDQAKRTLKHAEGSVEREIEMIGMKQMWRQAFPEGLPRRNEALDKFLNFSGDLTYGQVLEGMGPLKKAEAHFWRKHEGGVIDIEGMDYLLNSFKDLPNQPVLKRSTIVGQLNRQGVPQVEKDVVLRALRDRDSITQAELVGSVAADVLPLKPKEIVLSERPSSDTAELASGMDRLGAGRSTQTNIIARVWQMPARTDLLNHFDDPQYFAHTRGFEKQGVRYIAEMQSDLMQQQSGLRKGLGTAVEIDEIFSGMADVLPRIAPLEKRWYERILMEENRQASKDGVRAMRVATADTAAKLNQWVRGLTLGRHTIPETAISGGRFVTEVLVRSDNSIELRLKSGTPIEAYTMRMGELGPVLSKVPREKLPPNLQGIYNFYKQEVASFTRSRFGAREVADEFNNTWMEWKIDPADATKKIPAFGGRQRGVVDIPEFEDVVRAAERGKTTAEQATTRGWTAPSVADDATYAKAKAAFERSRAAEVEGHKVTVEGMLKRARREVVAHDYDLRAELERAGPYGQKAVDRLALQNGATMAAKSRMDAVNENIFNNLDSATKTQVDELMRLRRIIEIDSYKGVGKHKHPEGITGPEAEAVAIRMKQELGDKQFARVYDATNRVMKEYKDILSRRFETGLLSEESYLKLLHFDYSPTEFIDLIDPLQTYTVRGHRITVRTSGVPYLERGKRGAVVMDSQVLLAEALVRSENLIFKNETLKQLHELATKAPENSVVSLPPKGAIGKAGTPDAYMKHTPRGQVALGVRVGGKQDFVLMREDLAEQFIHRPQVMSEFVSSAARLLSGTALVKATATTYNPAFIVSGLPMDVLHTWLATARDYSPHPPVFAGQMAADLAATARDAWMKGPKYQQALREGLGSAFMTHEGRGFSGMTQGSLSVAERQMMPRFDKLKGALSYVNESADIWIRMAHRERLIKNGLESWQATGQARNRLDYSAGGELTRAIDTVIPYTNVAVQALSKVIKAGAKDKADLGIKLAWGGSIITAWTLANMVSSPETWQQVSTSDKIRSLPITFGDQWYITDPDGNKRYVYMPGVRLDAVVGPIAATIVGGLEAAEYGKAPDSILTRSMTNLNPVVEFQAPPTIEAMKTYLSNFDAFTGRRISPQFGQVKPEDEGTTFGRGEPSSALSRIMGGTLGMSPPRLDAAARKVINPNNLYLGLMGWGYKYLLEGSDPRVVSEATEQIYLSNPAVRPFVKLTSPSSQYLRDVEGRREEEGSRRKQMTDSVDDLLFQVRKGQLSLGELKTYIRNQPPEDREWLTGYATTAYNMKEIMRRFGASEGIPNETWWRAVASLPARPRAQEFYSQWLSAEPEDRKRMEKIAVGLHNKGAGFYNDDFKRELVRERTLLGTEQR